MQGSIVAGCDVSFLNSEDINKNQTIASEKQELQD
jgi:hypothetical protein